MNRVFGEGMGNKGGGGLNILARLRHAKDKTSSVN